MDHQRTFTKKPFRVTNGKAIRYPSETTNDISIVSLSVLLESSRKLQTISAFPLLVHLFCRKIAKDFHWGSIGIQFPTRENAMDGIRRKMAIFLPWYFVASNNICCGENSDQKHFLKLIQM